MRDARLAGMDPGSIAALQADLNAESGEGVWPQNIETVRAFFAAGTQWRTTMLPDGASGFRLLWVGLDYQGAKVAIEAMNIEVDPSLWAGLALMEEAAMAVMNGETGRL